MHIFQNFVRRGRAPPPRLPWQPPRERGGHAVPFSGNRAGALPGTPPPRKGPSPPPCARASCGRTARGDAGTGAGEAKGVRRTPRQPDPKRPPLPQGTPKKQGPHVVTEPNGDRSTTAPEEHPEAPGPGRSRQPPQRPENHEMAEGRSAGLDGHPSPAHGATPQRKSRRARAAARARGRVQRGTAQRDRARGPGRTAGAAPNHPGQGRATTCP